MKKSVSTGDFIKEYFAEVKRALDGFDVKKIEKVVELIMEAYEYERHIFIFGNGGSASTASHMACDLGKGTLSRIYDDEEKRLRVISLNDNMALFSALANDLSYPDVFTQQLRNLVKKDDLVIAITGSGNSRNIIEAIKYSKRCGAKTVGFLGFTTGGEVGKLVDHSVVAQSNLYGPVEDVHLVLNHVVSSVFARLKKEVDVKYTKAVKVR